MRLILTCTWHVFKREAETGFAELTSSGYMLTRSMVIKPQNPALWESGAVHLSPSCQSATKMRNMGNSTYYVYLGRGILRTFLGTVVVNFPTTKDRIGMHTAA